MNGGSHDRGNWRIMRTETKYEHWLHAFEAVPRALSFEFCTSGISQIMDISLQNSFGAQVLKRTFFVMITIM